MLIHTACRLELNEWLQADGIGRRGGLKPIRPAAQPGTRMSGVRGRRRALAPHTFDVLSFGSPTWHRDGIPYLSWTSRIAAVRFWRRGAEGLTVRPAP